MSDLLNKQICLKLNTNWFAVGFESVQKAFSEICSLGKTSGKPPRLPIDITYAQNEDGSYDTNEVLDYRPVSVAEWFTLPVRLCDLAINCNHRMVRVPTVTICPNYRDIPASRVKFSPDAVKKREGGRCAISGRILAEGEGDLGHDVAKSKGGRKSWENVAYVEKGLNRGMGTKTFAEAGYPHVKKKMVAPRAGVKVLTVADMKHESQRRFLTS